MLSRALSYIQYCKCQSLVWLVSSILFAGSRHAAKNCIRSNCKPLSREGSLQWLSNKTELDARSNIIQQGLGSRRLNSMGFLLRFSKLDVDHRFCFPRGISLGWLCRTAESKNRTHKRGLSKVRTSIKTFSAIVRCSPQPSDCHQTRLVCSLRALTHPPRCVSFSSWVPVLLVVCC